MNHCEFDHGQEVDGKLLESCSDPSSFFEPTDALLDDAPASIGGLVEQERSTLMVGSLVVPLRDHGTDAVLPEPLANARVAVSFVPGQTVGPRPGPSEGLGDGNALHHRLDPRGIVDLTGGDFRREGKALTVSDQVDFAAESAPRAAQSVVSGFLAMLPETFFGAPAAAREARMCVPSIHHKSQSMWPSRSSRIWRASKIRSKLPFFRHVLKYPYTVSQGPKRSGRSRQGAPVLRIHSTPLSISRAVRRGRPVLARGAASKGSISFHWSSVTSCRWAIEASSSVYSSHRQNFEFSNRA